MDRYCRQAGYFLMLGATLVAFGTMLAAVGAADPPPVSPNPASPNASAPRPEEELQRQRQVVSEQIETLVAAESDPLAESTTTSSEMADELDLLRTLDSLFAQHQGLLQQRADLDGEQKRIQDLLDRLLNFGPDEPKPYSFLLLEDIRDQREAEAAREQATRNDRRAAEQLLDTVRDEYDQCEQERRLAQEELEQNEDSEKTAGLTREVRLAELASALRREKVALRKLEIEVKSARLTVCESQQSLLREKAERVTKQVSFSEHDLKSRLGDLTKYSLELKRRLRDAELRLQRLDAEQAAAMQPVGDTVEHRSLRGEITDAYRLARRCCHDEITLVNQRLAELERFKHFWECRYEVINGKASPGDLEDWLETATEFRDQLRQAEQSVALRLDEIHLDQATLFRRSHEGSEASAASIRWRDFQTEQLRHLADFCETSVVHLKAAQRSAERFLNDLDERLAPAAKLDPLGSLRQWIADAWAYEIASVDDRPITIGKIVMLLVYVTMGLLFARLVARLAARRLLPRFGLNEGAVHAVQSILFYSLSVIFTLLSLEMVHLPFAAFTFLGGAAAIGIGFGSQNILNNFISGLILLTEQPIRVGDLVEIDQIQGTVEHIGPRSTCVRTACNHELIVPNSKLLENKVVNLTLSDNLVQTAIGIAMSPQKSVEESRRLLKYCAASHPKVLASPEPIVLFKEFSASTIAFELHFWLRLHNVMECRIVESDVREQIHELFRDATPTTVGTAVSTETPTLRRARLAS